MSSAIILWLVTFVTCFCFAVTVPNISITFPDIADVDYSNSTHAFVSNSNPIFVLHCNATYPVEWIIHYSREDDGTSEIEKNIKIYRHVENFKDPATYVYSTTMRLAYNGKLLLLANFTCKHASSEDTNRQNHVIMGEENARRVLILEISKKYEGNKRSVENLMDSIDTKDKSVFANVSHVSTEYSKRSCWSCQTIDGEFYELDFLRCGSASQCNSMLKDLQRGKEFLILRHLDEYPDPLSKLCKHVDGDFEPKLVVCKNFGPALAQLYFHGVFHESFYNVETSTPPTMYFQWADIQPQEMIFFHPVETKAYVLQRLQFTCEYSIYYFAYGSWFAVKSQHETVYYKGNDIKPKLVGHQQSSANNAQPVVRGTYRSTFNVTLNHTGEYEMFCIGPVWNSTVWVNTSRSLMVTEGEKPRVLSIQPLESTQFFYGERNRKIICNFRGIPGPSVKWTTPNLIPINITSGLNFSQLLIPEVGYQTAGNYKCWVSSYLGNHSMDFEIDTKLKSEQLPNTAIAAIAAGCIIFVLVAGAVIWRMWKIITVQRKQLRILTDAEIKEFLEGNPDTLNTEQNKGFLSTAAMEALPFDGKYEILRENLEIDYARMLGSGQFGYVFHEKISDESKVNDYNKDLQGSELAVAVKICKKNVDITHFKSLLAELKVMAYLGKHDNLVSLVGAATGSIRNRELLIVVEFCEGGSLENYIKANKSHFVNYLNTGINAQVDYANLNETIIFSTKDLFKWSSEIAHAMEYMHNKRVIHGDLAIRNVLLTKHHQAKVGDFGLSRQLTETSSYTKQTQCPLPWRNMAVESLKGFIFSPKSDMWSLGITYWELFSLGQSPYPGLNYAFDFIDKLENGMRLYKPPGANHDMYDFMLMCWNITPEDRPSPQEAIQICQKFLIKPK